MNLSDSTVARRRGENVTNAKRVCADDDMTFWIQVVLAHKLQE
jgi:hypothetical protein